MCEILVVFEIKNELQRQEFINKIKSLGAWARVLSNAYIVRSSSKTAVAIRNNLIINIKDSDRLFVVDIEDSDWAARNLPVEVNKWLKY